MADNPKKITVGISSCLLGERVRYDGGDKYDPLINTQLAELFEFRPCCPEMAIGLGVPREPIQLVRTARGIRVRGVQQSGHRCHPQAAGGWQQHAPRNLRTSAGISSRRARPAVAWPGLQSGRNRAAGRVGRERCLRCGTDRALVPVYRSRTRSVCRIRYCASSSSKPYSPGIAVSTPDAAANRDSLRCRPLQNSSGR